MKYDTGLVALELRDDLAAVEAVRQQLRTAALRLAALPSQSTRSDVHSEPWALQQQFWALAFGAWPAEGVGPSCIPITYPKLSFRAS